MSITIKDVAKKAGVSHTTISKVLHNSKGVSFETKKRVLKIIRQMGYYPNYLARSLVRGKTNTIAVITSYFYFSSFFEVCVLNGIEKSIIELKNKYMTNLYSTGGDKRTKEDLLRSILYGRRADALIGINLDIDKKLLKEFKEKNFPIVLIDAVAEGVHSIMADNVKGAYIATDYLAKQGRRKIGIIVGRMEGENAGIAPKDRLKGFQDALRDNNLEFNPEAVIEIQNYSFADGKYALEQFKSKGIEIDAVFCAAGDLTAMGFINYANEIGVKVPDEVAIVGYDDIEIAALVTPPLTTIRQPILDMGMEALKIAVDCIEGKITERKLVIFEPKLIIRKSA